jgi:hypothetical protein
MIVYDERFSLSPAYVIFYWYLFVSGTEQNNKDIATFKIHAKSVLP